MGRKSKAKVRRQEILSHFYEIIIEEGFEGASIGKIAKRMEVNPSLIIHYFSTKDAMVLGLIEYIVTTYESHILPDFSKSETSQERWDDLLDVLSQTRWDLFVHKNVFYNCYALALRNEEVKEYFVRLYETIIGKLIVEIEHARSAGIVRVHNTRYAAETMYALVEGTNFNSSMHRTPHSREERSLLLKRNLLALFGNGQF